MGFIKKAVKKMSGNEVQDSGIREGSRMVNLDAGDYLAVISDVSITEIARGKNAGKEQLKLTVKVLENWDGEAVPPEASITSWVGLFSHWASGHHNFTLVQFLKSLPGGWDYDEDEPLFDIEDEEDAQDSLMGVEIKIRVGYRVSEATARFPANVFNEIDAFLPEKAELKPDERTGTYEEFKARQDLAPAGGGVAGRAGSGTVNKSRDTDTEITL